MIGEIIFVVLVLSFAIGALWFVASLAAETWRGYHLWPAQFINKTLPRPVPKSISEKQYCEHCGCRLLMYEDSSDVIYDPYTGRPTKTVTVEIHCPNTLSACRYKTPTLLYSYEIVDGKKKKVMMEADDEENIFERPSLDRGMAKMITQAVLEMKERIYDHYDLRKRLSDMEQSYEDYLKGQL